MKILWLAHEGNLSGANICLLEYIEILKNNNVANHLIVPMHGPMATAATTKVESVTAVKFYTWIWPVNNKTASLQYRLRRYFRNKRAVKQLVFFIQLHNPDFVVTNTVTSPVAAIAAKKTGKKHVWFVHEFGEEDHGYTMAGNFGKAATVMNKLSYKIVFNSKAVQQKYEPFVPARKRCIVHNATPEPYGISHEIAQDEIKVVMLGRVHHSKNQLEAMKAIKLCVDRGLKLQLNIVGSAEDEDYVNTLNTFIKNNQLESVVKLLGATNKPGEILVEHELLLMCSRMEAFGRVTVEALKHGLPVVAANTGGSIEIIDESNGFLYEAGNVEDLANKIQAYYESRQSFNRSKIAADANATYNFSNTKKQLLEVFS